MTRERSNALGGPQDPRVPADKQLAVLFAIPIPVAQGLENFLKSVYARKDLMTWNDLAHNPDERLADEIYDLYSTSGGGPQAAADDAAMDQARIVWGKIDKLVGSRADVQARFQYTGSGIKHVLASKKRGTVLRACGDFLYFTLKDVSSAYRVYLNLDFGSMPALVTNVLALDEVLRAQVGSFKVCGPGGARADSVVIYCKSKEAAEGIAARMAELIKQGTLASTNQTVPAMTTRIAPGVSIGAEPVQQATGLGAKPKEYGEAAQSFGTIRSELIAGAIFTYQDNRHSLGDTFKTFKQFVAIAFNGYGLDPSRPGD